MYRYPNGTVEAFHDAVRAGNLQAVMEWLSKGVVDVEATDVCTTRPIHIAAGHGHLDIIKALIARGCDVNAQTSWVTHTGVVMSRGITALHCAASRADPNLALTLIRAGANVNVMDNSGKCPLHIAAENGHLSIVKALVSANADVNAQDMKSSPFYATPLICAVAKNFEDVADFLVQNGAIVNASNSRRWTPLHFAAERGNINVTKLLIQNKAAVNAKTEDDLTTLHVASQIEISQMLIDSGVAVNARDSKYGRTPLLHAAYREYSTETISLLINSGAHVNARDSNRWTPLLHAAYRGPVETVNLLIKSGADVNVRSNDGCTPLLKAAEGGRPAEIARLLIVKGASVNARDSSGRTPLFLAASNGCTDIVNILIEYKADVNYADEGKFTSLHTAASKGNLEIVKILIANGAQDDARDLEQTTPLHFAAECCHVEVVKYLLAKGAEVNATDHRNWTPLHFAAGGCAQLALFFLERSGHSDAQEQDRKRNTMKVLIENGADINAKGIDDETALHVAVKEFSDLRAARYLLENGAYYDVKARSYDGNSSVPKNADEPAIKLLGVTEKLFQAVKGAKCAEIEKCIQEGAPVNSRSIKCETPLMYASWKGQLAVVNVLLKNGANVNLSNSNGVTPLHYAAKFGHHEIVCALLQQGAVYNAKTKTGKKTPLHFAQEGGKKIVADTLELIERMFIRITESDDTFLKLRDINCAEFLAIKNCKNVNEETLTQMGTKNGYDKLCKLLYDL